MYGNIGNNLNLIRITMAEQYRKFKEAVESMRANFDQFESSNKSQNRKDPMYEEETPVKLDYKNLNPKAAVVNLNSAIRQSETSPWNHQKYTTQAGRAGSGLGGSGSC